MRALLVGLLVGAAVLFAWRSRRLRPVRSVSGRGRSDRGRFSAGSERAGPEPDPALLLDLCAAALSAGAPPAVALQVAGQAVGGQLGRMCELVGATLLLGASHEAAWAAAPSQLDTVRRGLQLVSAAGVPGADLMRRAAVAERAAERLRAEALAQALGVRMVLPLGLCALPAFAAWGVVPVVLALAGELL